MRTHRFATVAVAGTLALSPLALTACGDDTAGPEEGVSVGDIQEEDEADAGADTGADVTDVPPAFGYTGTYDDGFGADPNQYVGQTVTVSATVNELIGPNAFTIAGTANTSVPALLVIGEDSASGLESGQVVQVSGTVEDPFNEATAEGDLGIELTDDAFLDFQGDVYLVADSVDTSVPIEDE
ncbi:hypothetical protein [Modestobacter roseus]|uniref:DUF5666 domain-containing protein n=1 Tax=Modestobacter roseus TaxID=1181884 RepID=A0A562IVW3_9ACTN|nr:hypothetical protein [Modestobacter roseus]MQA34738.1 hypothetical protein [Modestobacter roseus]TWH75098.1 hypothetical protein JD78_03649 [Modestobacter roseus]